MTIYDKREYYWLCSDKEMVVGDLKNREKLNKNFDAELCFLVDSRMSIEFVVIKEAVNFITWGLPDTMRPEEEKNLRQEHY